MLKITVISVGKKHDSQFQDAIEHYQQRLAPFCQLRWELIPSSNVIQETERIIQKLPRHNLSVLLDGTGKHITSEGIARFIAQQQNHAQTDIAIIIGGAYGVDDTLRSTVDYTFSLGPLTLPHQLVRVILLEQLYRGFAILSGSPYHHSG